jgi:methylenetetrahydrofolate reductase (NADPH)
VPRDRLANEGLRLRAETTQQVLAISGVIGIHIMAPGFEHGIPAILETAGLPPRVPACAGSADWKSEHAY